MSAPVALANLVGHVVEPYKLVELIHAGTGAAIYRAINLAAPSSSHGRDLHSDRAVKVVPKDGPVLGALEIGLHNLVSDHPNVVTMYDAFEDEDYYFIVLDLCVSGDLHTKIFDECVYHHNDALVRSAFLQIVDAVEACHAANVYHRDLKPENILCNEDGSEVYLCDFGMGSSRPISREFGCGTSSYMSPECLGEDLGHRPYSNTHHDIWALGVILVNMITQSYPWTRATTNDDQFSQYLHNPRFFLDNFDISEGANTILRSIFVLNPMGRITLPQLRAAILELDSFFRPRDSPEDVTEVTEDIDDTVFSLFVVDEDGEEVDIDEEELYIYSTPDRFCAPAKPFAQPLELDLLSVDAAVRSFFVGSDDDALPVIPRLTSVSSDESDDEDDGDLPITPGATTPIYDVGVAEVNVYEGSFTGELRGTVLPPPKWSETSSKAALSPVAMDFSFVSRHERIFDVV
ncbi:kinase-like domain-containing protein [Trametes polyzona]|nr:kinase-like domain-containing protein [Trametes polyzona]